MADWEALFAQASDIPTANSSSSTYSSSKRPKNGDDDNFANDNHGDGHQTTNKEKPRKQRKRQRTYKNSYGSSGSSPDRCYQSLLKSRLNPPPELTTPWFSWMTLEQSFLDGNIRYMEQQEGPSSKIQPSKSKESPMSYRLVLAKKHQYSQQESWHLSLFCHNRNLRCCAKLLAQWDTDEDTNDGDESTKGDKGKVNIKVTSKQQKKSLRQRQQHQKSLFRSLQSEANEINAMLQSIQANLPNDEANLLLSKVTDMTALVEKLLHRRKRERKQSESGVTTKKDNQLPWSWEPSIRIIMASDNIYYRLYYQQLTGMIPVASKHHDTDEGWYIPHPPFYFGLEGFTVQSKEEDAKGTSNKTKSIIPVLMQSAQELKDSSPELQALLDHLVVGTTNSKGPANHALEAIHRQRFQETMLLFQDRGWASSARSLPQWNTSLSLPVDPESKHETPAPHLLMEWRDSCRDFLCHLYAYATVSSKVLCQLVDLLAKLQKEESMDLSKGIVEIGAGTGYLAETLRAHGVAVQAWDIQPTSVKSVGDNSGGMNEYHGHVPPFCDVYKASTFPSTSHADRSALLLCYPPPESPMALNTLSAYRKAGGQCLIHIGEFKGLTGDSKFEKVLRKGDMHCVARYPCLGWGTDAAYVSVWIAKGSNPKILASSKVLLPCSAAFCSKEAKHRCRPLRQVVYCNQVCYDLHTPGRNFLLSLFSVHTDPNLTSFGSLKAFAQL